MEVGEQFPPSVDERVAAGVMAAYMQHGFVLDGEPDKVAVEDKTYSIVSRAVVDSTAERGTKAVTRPKLMSLVYPNVPGPEAWDEQDDPEVAAKVHGHLNSHLWRICDANSTGPIQSRLNGDTGLILCRTTATPGKEPAVYVTKDIACLKLDFSGPFKAQMEKAAKKHAVNLAMATARLPEYASTFEGELRKGLAQAKKSAEAALFPALNDARVDEPSE